jgi:hypothetical protein
VGDDRDDPLFGPPDAPSVPGGPTQPIRPPDPGTAPIPDRVRQPIVVPQKESTIAGLPRALVIAVAVGLVLALLVGFLIGRAMGGDEATPAGGERGGRRGCERALALAIQVVEIQRQALANRTQFAEALAVDDESQVQELNAALEPLSIALRDAEGQLGPAVERCQAGGGRAKGGGKGKNAGNDGGNDPTGT